MSQTGISRAFPTFLIAGFFLVSFFAVLVSATIHPLAGLVIVFALPGLGIIAQYEFTAVRVYVFLFLVVPLYLRLPGFSLLSPVLLFFLALFTIVFVRLLLQSERLPWSTMHWLALCYIIVVVLTSISPYFSALTIRQICYQVLLPIGSFLLIFYTCKDTHDVQHILDAITIAAVVIAAYSIPEYFLQKNWLIENFLLQSAFNKFDEDVRFFYAIKDELLSVYRTFSTFESPLEFATVLGMVFAYPVLASIHHPSIQKRALYALAAILILFALLLTFSRWAWISATVVGVFLFVRESAVRRFMLLGAIVGVVTVAILYPFYATMIQARMSDSATFDTRLGMYRLALLMFLDRPFMGVGYGNFGHYTIEYANRYGAGGFRFPLELFQVVDSTYFHLLCEMGLLGLTTYLMILVAFFLCCVRLVRLGGTIRSQATAVGLGVMAYAVNGVAAYPLHLTTIATQLFWIYIGLAYRLAALQQSNERRLISPRLESNHDSRHDD